MGAAVSEGEGNEMRLHLRVGFGWARLVFSPDREARTNAPGNAMVLRAASVAAAGETRCARGEGGAVNVNPIAGKKATRRLYFLSVSLSFFWLVPFFNSLCWIRLSFHPTN